MFPAFPLFCEYEEEGLLVVVEDLFDEEFPPPAMAAMIIITTIIAIAIKHPGLLEFELDFDGVPYEREGTFRPSESTSC